MLATLLRQSLERIPAEDRQPELDGSLDHYQAILVQIVGRVEEARRDGAETVTVRGMELVIAEGLDLIDQCLEATGYEATGALVAGVVAGLAMSEEPGAIDGE